MVEHRVLESQSRRINGEPSFDVPGGSSDHGERAEVGLMRSHQDHMLVRAWAETPQFKSSCI